MSERKVTQAQVDQVFESATFEDLKIGLKTTTVCMTLPSGFEIVETSSCVDPENYDHLLGVEICKKRLKDRLWYLLGFMLQEQQPVTLGETFEIKTFEIILNGERKSAIFEVLLYEDIVKKAGLTGQPTVTWRDRVSQRQGVLRPGETIQMAPGLVINVADTSRA